MDKYLSILYPLVSQWSKPITAQDYYYACDQYFSFCADKEISPGIEGLCMALHMSSERFLDVVKGYIVGDEDEFEEKRDIMRSSYQLIMAYLEQLALKGDLKPATPIFLLKNWGEYKDARVIETRKKVDDGEKDALKYIEAKYIEALPDD